MQRGSSGTGLRIGVPRRTRADEQLAKSADVFFKTLEVFGGRPEEELHPRVGLKEIHFFLL